MKEDYETVLVKEDYKDHGRVMTYVSLGVQ